MNDPKSSPFTELTPIGQVVLDKMAILLNFWNFGSKLQVNYLGRNKFGVSFENMGVLSMGTNSVLG